jgi:hypothetical protein
MRTKDFGVFGLRVESDREEASTNREALGQNATKWKGVAMSFARLRTGKKKKKKKKKHMEYR